MRLVVGILIALVGVAHADRPAPPDKCKPLAPLVLPADGATVPLNTKVWQLGAKEGFYDYRKWIAGETKPITVQGEPFDHNDEHPALRFPLHDLEPSFIYHLEGSGPPLSFETSGEVDTTPPAPPLVRVEINLEYQPLERMPVAQLLIRGQIGEGTALVQIVVEDRLSRQTVTTTPDHLNLCKPGLRLAPGMVSISVYALDLAGNRSEAYPQSVHVLDPTSIDPQGHVRAGIGSMSLILFGPVLLAAILLAILLVLSLRHWRHQNGEGEAITPLVADHIARAVARRAASGSVAALAAFTSAWIFGHGLLVLLVGLIACVPLSSLVASRRVMRELDADRARAELRESVLIVRSPMGQARLATSTRLIDEARKNAVPKTVAR